MLAKQLTTMLAVVGLATASSGALAYSTYFGEDQDGGTSTPASFKNADIAAGNFLGNLQGVGTETFESFANGSTPPINLTFPGAGTATLTGSATIVTVPHGTTNCCGRYAHSGNNFVETQSTNFTVGFGSNVAAFGFYGMDIGEFGGDLWIRVHQAGGGTVDVDVPNVINGADGSDLYFGLIAASAGEEFTSIEFFDKSGTGADLFAFDDMTIGSLQQVVNRTPEPGSLALLGLALGGLTLFRRRKAS
jgi:hypothetical protein